MDGWLIMRWKSQVSLCVVGELPFVCATEVGDECGDFGPEHVSGVGVLVYSTLSLVTGGQRLDGRR